MGKSDRILPPGPNPREDQMSGKHQRQLRSHMRGQEGGSGEHEETEAADQAEGERERAPARKVKGTPGQAEGERRTVEKEIEHQERRKH